MYLFRWREFVDSLLVEQVGNVFLIHHEAHEHVLVGQLFLIGFCIESVEHVVVLHSGVTAYCLETTVMIGEYQSIWRNDHSRAISREVYHHVLDSVIIVVDGIVGQ